MQSFFEPTVSKTPDVAGVKAGSRRARFFAVALAVTSMTHFSPPTACPDGGCSLREGDIPVYISKESQHSGVPFSADHAFGGTLGSQEYGLHSIAAWQFSAFIWEQFFAWILATAIEQGTNIVVGIEPQLLPEGKAVSELVCPLIEEVENEVTSVKDMSPRGKSYFINFVQATRRLFKCDGAETEMTH